MALIKCVDCGAEVSDRADKCPKCAGPIIHPSESKTQTIELTGKDLKLQMLIGSAIFIVGILLPFTGRYNFINWVSILGFGIIIGTKVRRWWYHG